MTGSQLQLLKRRGCSMVMDALRVPTLPETARIDDEPVPGYHSSI